jgi:hypothetical protein
MSETKKITIEESIIEAKKEFKQVKKGSVNQFFKKNYASLENIIEAVGEALLKHGLWFKFEEDVIDFNNTVTQITTNKDGSKTEQKVVINSIKTIIYNKEGDKVITPHNYAIEELTSQGFGKASTYAQRYGLSAALGIVGEDDNDGNSSKQTPAPAKTSTTSAPKPQTPAPVGGELTLDGIKNTEGVNLVETDTDYTVSGKTYSLSAGLKTLGFVWDGKDKVWKKTKPAPAQQAA